MRPLASDDLDLLFRGQFSVDSIEGEFPRHGFGHVAPVTRCHDDPPDSKVPEFANHERRALPEFVRQNQDSRESPFDSHEHGHGARTVGTARWGLSAVQ